MRSATSSSADRTSLRNSGLCVLLLPKTTELQNGYNERRPFDPLSPYWLQIRGFIELFGPTQYVPFVVPVVCWPSVVQADFKWCQILIAVNGSMASASCKFMPAFKLIQFIPLIVLRIHLWGFDVGERPNDFFFKSFYPTWFNLAISLALKSEA